MLAWGSSTRNKVRLSFTLILAQASCVDSVPLSSFTNIEPKYCWKHTNNTMLGKYVNFCINFVTAFKFPIPAECTGREQITQTEMIETKSSSRKSHLLSNFLAVLMVTDELVRAILSKNEQTILLPSVLLSRTLLFLPLLLLSRSGLVTAVLLPQLLAAVTLLYGLIMIKWLEPTCQMISKQCRSWTLHWSLLKRIPQPPTAALSNHIVS